MTKLTGEQIVDAIKNPRIVVGFKDAIFETEPKYLVKASGMLCIKNKTLYITCFNGKDWEQHPIAKGRYSILNYLNEHKRDITIIS